MIDLELIRSHPDLVKKAITDKGINLDLDEFINLDQKRRQLISEREQLLAERNSLSVEQAKQVGKEIKVKLAKIQPELAKVEEKFNELSLLLPQIPSPESPIGGEENNKVLREVGKKPNFDFKVKDHIELGESLNLIDLEAGRRVSGFRGYFLKNEAVLMQYGLMQLGLNLMQEKGFTLMSSPTVLKEFALVGSGHFPFGRPEVYQIANAARLETDNEKETHFLAGTAEPSLLAYFANQELSLDQLPQKVCGISPCYRSEAGSYGKDAKGLYRVHEFMKVEQVIISEASLEAQQSYFDEMLAISEELLGSLDLPYRIINIATGDMGAGKYYMNDIETWMPGRGDYGETHSSSALGDWQARRLGIKYKNQDGKKLFAFTLNNTVVASPRILIAILENYQQADGSIRVPKVLQKFVGKELIKA